MTYTLQNLLASATSPSVGGTAIATTYEYNDDRDLTQINRPDGSEITYDYDSAGRLQGVETPEGTQDVDYDSQTKQVSALETEDGQRTEFDFDGVLQKGQTYDGAIDGEVELAHDSRMRLSSIDTVAGATGYEYDRDSLITEAGGMTIARNNLTGLPVGTAIESTTSETIFNQFAEPASDSYAFPGGSFAEVYERDQLGRITAKEVTLSGTTTRYDYTYDLAGRLTEATKNGSPWRAYAFDANSNRTLVTRGAASESATFDAQDKMSTQGDLSLTYNANGELTGKTNTATSEAKTFTYSSTGQLTGASVGGGNITYAYDALGNRIMAKVNGSTTQAFLYAPGILGPVAQLSKGSSQQTSYVYGSRTNVPDLMERGGVTYRIITDQLGSVRLVVNASTGAVAQRIEYDPFGEVTLDTSPGFQPFGFAGGLYDNLTGLTHFGAREYDAGLGRWTSRDPISFAGGDSNLYGYVVQDPVNWIDPSGLYAVNYPGRDTIRSVGNWAGDAVDAISPNFGTQCGRSFWDRAKDNFSQTNGFVIGWAAPTGTGLLTGGKLAENLGYKSIGRWLIEVVHSPGKVIALIKNWKNFAYLATVNGALVAGAWEGGVAIGSLLRAAYTCGCP